jgi:HEPN domain-containing protein
MKDFNHARLLFGMAQKDFKALAGMTDTNVFADEIFGFHAQQVVEKLLKTWLSLLGIEYPRIHDLEELFEILEEHGQNVSSLFRTLIDLTDFAVMFRYEAYEDQDQPLDRPKIIEKISTLLSYVENILKNMGTSALHDN